MNVLITGGAGFVGTFTKKALKNEGYNPILLDNFLTGSTSNVQLDDVIIKGDILDSSLNEVLEPYGIDAIIHLAAQTSVPSSVVDPVNDLQLNIEGTVRMLELARSLSVKKFVFASTAAVYGNNEQVPLKESEHLMPTAPYGVSKASCEMYVSAFCEANGIGYSILRYSNIYGPKQTKDGEGGVIKIFLDKLLNGEQVSIFGDGGQTRDFIFVEDIARANCAALRVENGIYNVSSNEEITVNELYRIMAREMGSPLEPVYGEPREGDIYRSCLDNQVFMGISGWKPEISLTEGIRETVRQMHRAENLT
ncbi:NAD-dependent epimerase/dehydratase family protein [Fictibacillus enclensis]|uniref:NAD-dependent epimerase/dehydratase family protein n=1 Tax=Fictibacillus enclensis TaxID=1017270 RepID=UPI0025A08852|nr:NAD-dependent epimerase/dehydratase family protein [Fictibacillus enclensis]MDM5340092.1 NAD-dependent epimerase/dehydratase family protein [Fictibacillus enclensis]